MEYPNQNTCPSCQAPRPEKYCPNCGEKKIASSDFTLQHIFGEGFSFLTNLDSKLYNTIVGLLFKPGTLTKAYIDGRRQPYMKPFQIFVLSSILFYLLMSDMDLFLVPSKWFFNDEGIMLTVEGIMAEKNWTREVLAEKYDQQVTNNSKLYIFMLLPFMALLFYVFNRKKQKEFGKYLILAVHELSFFLVLCASTAIVYFLPISPENKWWVITPVMLIYLWHLVFAIQKVFDRRFAIALSQGLIVGFFFLILVFSYRNGVSYFTLLNL
jgi:Protein of unknown function (DUF3667)